MAITSTEFNRRSGKWLDASQHGPIMIEKQGNPFSVVLSFEDFQQFKLYEDEYLANLLLRAEKKGLLTESEVEEAIAYLKLEPSAENYSSFRETAYVMATMPEVMATIRAKERGEKIEAVPYDRSIWE